MDSHALGEARAGDAKENIGVEDEDMILIPRVQAFFVVGEIKAGGTFPLEKETSVLEAVTIAGGFTDKAARSGVKVIRRTPDGEEASLQAIPVLSHYFATDDPLYLSNHHPKLGH